ncbi:PRD domain-containing protein [Demequina capsici]|uniref:PRD domain-containing protein n=1 Tax=Demequina capsici TaxID=3075620 RepID=A0AA96F7W7_9MICO|nr:MULTISPECIES: PRD domain-containing protein [unclassified Demequina]WNM25731.1 PRD domain-containing protein [Demequina sp. OYTSA14]WNM28626.1 PRD domain-containing protein [Demequina sp. PMTSA13]
MRIAKVFNNSVVLGTDEQGGEVVLFGRGVGFQAKRGDVVDESLVERRFVPGANASADRIAALIESLPGEDIDLTERIVAEGRAALGDHVTDHVLVPLADHISFALRRAREQAPMIDYPLRYEVESLYAEELQFARKALTMIEQSTGVRLPDVEAVPLALHFVNAQFGARDISTTVNMTTELAHMLDIIRQEYSADIDEDSTAVARFVTHLRYLYVRGRSGIRRDLETPPLAEAIRATQPREHATATRMAEYLASRYGWDVGEGEVLYLSIHVMRLTAGLGVGTGGTDAG